MSAGSTNAPGTVPNDLPFNGPPGGGFMGMGGGDNAVALALTELRTVLSSTNAPASDIKAKVEAVRNARQKAKADLAAAETNLRLLLTTEQEAVLVSLGYLD